MQKSPLFKRSQVVKRKKSLGNEVFIVDEVSQPKYLYRIRNIIGNIDWVTEDELEPANEE